MRYNNKHPKIIMHIKYREKNLGIKYIINVYSPKID